jgi:hypothetical protein
MKVLVGLREQGMSEPDVKVVVEGDSNLVMNVLIVLEDKFDLE